MNAIDRCKTSLTLEALLDEREVSRIVGRSVASLRRDRLLRLGIPFTKLGALVRYDPRDIRAYIDANKQVVMNGE